VAREPSIRWRVLLVACIATALLAWAGQRRLRIDTDITSPVPTGRVAFESAQQVLARHTSLDRVMVNLSMRDGKANRDALIAAGDLLVAELDRSGLFSTVGTVTAARQAHIERGHILDAGGKNLLVAATPKDVTRDARVSHAIDDLLNALANRFAVAKPQEAGAGVVVTPVGGYRATIDNESVLTSDAKTALLASSIGIALLLLGCFPRPWLGVFALLPALVGGCLALFAYSLLERDISALALGFGGALVSLTVDRGALYLSFVDRKTKTTGDRAAHEVFAIGSLSTLIKMGACLSLGLTGFRVLGQLGLFAALGIVSSSLFVRLVFPRIFPSVPPATRSAWLPVDGFLRRITVGRGLRAFTVAAAVFVVALGFARPKFAADLGEMNTVSDKTTHDEANVREVWGDIFQRPYVFIDAKNEAAFDGKSFSQTLGDLPARAFRSMFVIVACFVAGAVLFFFLDLRVAAIALAPLAFSFVLTLATLHLLGRPIEFVGPILLVLIFGMGVDYSLSMVRVYQRCLDENHPSHAPVRTSIFLASSAAMIGMIALCTAKHAVTRSAGIMSIFAVGYAALGVFLFLPPLLRRLFSNRSLPPTDRARPGRWVMKRFRRLSAYPRCFAWFKMRLDPMFNRLASLAPEQGTVLDIGCGFGVAAAWMLGRCAELRVVGVEPDSDRVDVARFVLGTRGEVHEGAAPDALPDVTAAAVFSLDVIHHLDDAGLAKTLAHARKCLSPGGRLVLRASVPNPGPVPFYRWFETRRLAQAKLKPHYRQREAVVKAIETAGLRIKLVEPTAAGREETWFIAEVPTTASAT
jgi:SAM-dependent methyltransferase